MDNVRIAKWHNKFKTANSAFNSCNLDLVTVEMFK